MVEEKEMVWSHDAVPLQKLGVASKADALIFEREDSSGGQGTTHCT